MINTKLNPNDLDYAQDIEECSQNEQSFEIEASVGVQPRFGNILTLQGNGGMINGASMITMPIVSQITIGELPRATPLARFLGWSFTPTGQIAHPQIAVDSTMTLFARFEATNYNQMTRGELAQEIIHRFHARSLSGRRILIPQLFDNATNANGRSAFANLTQTAAGQEAQRSDVSGGSPPVAIGGTVPICENLLRAILRISDRYTNSIQINALAGTRHYRNSRHYGQHNNSTSYGINLPRLCMAVDLGVSGGNVVGTGVTRQNVLTFLEGIGFRTQRNATNAPSNNNYDQSGAGVFHLEIWGRS